MYQVGEYNPELLDKARFTTISKESHNSINVLKFYLHLSSMKEFY